jgi:hypothetical protein
MSLIENPCEPCLLYVGKLREITYSMREHGDITGFGKWEFYLGKMLEWPLGDDEAEAIEKMLCTNCHTLSIYGRRYIRELKERISVTDEKMQAVSDKAKADIARNCAPILDKITDGQKKLFKVEYGGMNSGKKADFRTD